MNDHKLTNRLSTITAFGDAITLLTIMVVIERSGFGVLNAAYGAVIKNLGILSGAIASFIFLNKFKTKTIFIITQIVSALLSLTVILNVSNKNPSLFILALF